MLPYVYWVLSQIILRIKIRKILIDRLTLDILTRLLSVALKNANNKSAI